MLQTNRGAFVCSRFITLTNPVCKTIYQAELEKLNISFKTPKVDNCHYCDVLETEKKRHTMVKLRQ